VRLFTLDSLFETLKSPQKFKATFYQGEIHALIVTKRDWATFWAILSQTHLVTLVGE
jgi:hypothetical protein